MLPRQAPYATVCQTSGDEPGVQEFPERNAGVETAVAPGVRRLIGRHRCSGGASIPPIGGIGRPRCGRCFRRSLHICRSRGLARKPGPETLFIRTYGQDYPEVVLVLSRPENAVPHELGVPEVQEPTQLVSRFGVYQLAAAVLQDSQ